MTRLSTGNGFPNVVVTGVAMTTALATDADSTWKKLLDGQSGIRKLEDPVRRAVRPAGSHRRASSRGFRPRADAGRTAPAVVPAEDVDGARPAGVAERRVAGGGSPAVDGVDRHRHGLDRGTACSRTTTCARRVMRAVSPLAVQKYMPNARGRRGRAGAQGQSRGDHSGVGVRLRLGGHRPGMAQHRARRGRHRDLRWRRVQDRGGADRGVRPDANRVVDHQRRPGRRLPSVRQGPQRVRVRRGRCADGHRDRGARQGARCRTSSPA